MNFEVTKESEIIPKFRDRLKTKNLQENSCRFLKKYGNITQKM